MQVQLTINSNNLCGIRYIDGEQFSAGNQNPIADTCEVTLNQKFKKLFTSNNYFML